METSDYSFILKLFTLLLPCLLIVFGLYLVVKNNNSRSGEITLGNLSIKKSTAGITFMAFGALCLIFAINKGVGMKSYESKTEREKKYDSLGNLVSETEVITVQIDSTAHAPEIIPSDSVIIPIEASSKIKSELK